MARIQKGSSISKKDFIIEKAAGLFRTKGYAATSVRDIANAVGVEAPSLYNHIGSKGEILQSICFRVANSFLTNLDEVDEMATIMITEKIERIIRFHIQQMLNDYDEVFVANHEWKQLADPYLNNFLSMRKNYEKKFMAIIEQGIERKELKQANPYITVLTILSAVRGLEFWKRNKNNIGAEILEDAMVQQLLYGIVNH